jgi:8-oxo-dGTP pyrophosphatase MutT (NUDIX family)
MKNFYYAEEGVIMREFWDLYDHERKLLGKTHQRGLPLKEGEFHVVVSVWTLNQDGHFLITLRSEEKELFPGHWENTAGSVMSGETSREAAIRELREETGIEASPDEITCLGTVLKVASFVDIFLVRKTLDPDSIRLQEGETTDYRWVSYEELKTLDRQGMLAFPLFDPFQDAVEKLF